MPHLGRSGWQLDSTVLAVLVRYNDRAFHQGVEDYGETLRQRPSRAALGLSRPLWSRARARVSYELEHNALGRSDLTAPDFVAPVAPWAHGVRLELEAHRGAWTGVVFGSAARRARWEPWGQAGRLEAAKESTSYQRFGASLARSLAVTPRYTARVEAAWASGHGLDRFSRYAIDSFLNRLRGYPAGSLRYDRGWIVRGQASAALRDGPARRPLPRRRLPARSGYGAGLRSYPGIGLGLQQALPRGALLAVEGGYAFAGRDRTGQEGHRGPPGDGRQDVLAHRSAG